MCRGARWVDSQGGGGGREEEAGVERVEVHCWKGYNGATKTLY